MCVLVLRPIGYCDHAYLHGTTVALTAGKDGSEVGIAERSWPRATTVLADTGALPFGAAMGSSVGPARAAGDGPPGGDQLNAQSELRADRANEGEPGHLD